MRINNKKLSHYQFFSNASTKKNLLWCGITKSGKTYDLSKVQTFVIAMLTHSTVNEAFVAMARYIVSYRISRYWFISWHIFIAIITPQTKSIFRTTRRSVLGLFLLQLSSCRLRNSRSHGTANASNNYLKRDKKLQDWPPPPSLPVCLNLSQGHYFHRRPDTWHLWWANSKSNARCRFMAELLITWSSRR